jgi:hypothetical protein
MCDYYHNFINKYNFENDSNHFNYYFNENNKEYKKRGYSLKGYNQNNQKYQNNQDNEVRKASKREYSSSSRIRHKINKQNRYSNRDIVLESLIEDKRPTFLPEQIMDFLIKGTARVEFEDNKNMSFTSFLMKIELKKKQ